MERRDSSITKEEKDRYASPHFPASCALCLPFQPPADLWSTFILSPNTYPPGTSPSHGPSCEYLLLLPRPELVRKGPGQPRNRCG